METHGVRHVSRVVPEKIKIASITRPNEVLKSCRKDQNGLRMADRALGEFDNIVDAATKKRPLRRFLVDSCASHADESHNIGVRVTLERPFGRFVRRSCACNSAASALLPWVAINGTHM